MEWILNIVYNIVVPVNDFCRYGSKQEGPSIPPNSTLVFVVELVKVN